MKSNDYQYSLALCDVAIERRSQLESYRSHRRRWISWLDTDEHHAIWTTLSQMVWTDVSFGTFRELAEGLEKTGEKSCLHNPLIVEQIVYGHVARRVLAIRRLMDKTSGVISLRPTDLPDMEKLEEAGLLSKDALLREARELPAMMDITMATRIVMP
jgi:hypothetical protein